MVMHLGIKQPRSKEVTGTIVMMDNGEDGAGSTAGGSTAENSLTMKRSNTGIILNPQPHDDPNDPLNWPIWRRDMCLMVIGFQSFLGGGQSPILAAGMSQLSTEFSRPLSTVSFLVGGFMLALGTGSVFASPSAVLYGKRLVYLAGIILFLVGSIVCASSDNFGMLMAGRVITGLGASPTESLPSATIAEIYFAHERAYRVGIYTMLLLGGKNIIPLLSGLVFQYLDRHWLYWILAIFLGTNLMLTFFFVPNTFWDRSPTPNKRSQEESEAARKVQGYQPPTKRPNAFAFRSATTNNIHEVESLSSSIFNTTANADSSPVGITNPDNESDVQIQKNSYLKDIELYSGRFTSDSWWMVALRPFFLYTYPSILFGSLTYSLAVVWLIVISEVIGEIFRGEGYGYDQQSVGLFYISPFVGGILGSLFTGGMSDRLSRFMVARNNGVYEPEFRLIMIIPSTIFICIGLMGFGWSSQEKDLWVGPVILFGVLSFGCSMASTTAITYTVDSYKMFAAEALVSLNFLKNLLGFVFSLFNNNFESEKGGRLSFASYGIIQIGVSCSAIPLYIYGKKMRAWTDRKELLRMLYHVDNLPARLKDDQPETQSDAIPHDSVFTKDEASSPEGIDEISTPQRNESDSPPRNE